MKRTALIYDERMGRHACPWDPAHPECPDRFTATMKQIREYRLEERCKVLKPRDATEEELRKVHSQQHIELLKSLKNCIDYARMEVCLSAYDSVYANEHTFELALSAAGCTVEIVKEVLSGNVDNGMAIVRPPGHHAMHEEFCGYCFFNNVAIAARHALDSQGLKRILIVDWDVHHGQATQYAFYDDPRVLYFSIHRYEHGVFWPELRESNFDHIGRGPGKGYNVNVPLNAAAMENWDYLAIFFHVLLPLASEFKPELILVSSGFDASLGDPEGEMRLTPAMYAHMTHLLRPYGPLCVILEGGYCVPALAEGAALVLKTLLSDPCPRMVNNVDSDKVPCPMIIDTIKNVIAALKPHWTCFYQECLPGVPQPEVHYRGTLSDNKPPTYPTKAYYNVLSEDTRKATLKEQEDLKRRTELIIARERFPHFSEIANLASRTLVKSHRFVGADSLLEATQIAKGSCLVVNFIDTCFPAFQELTHILAVYPRKLNMETKHDAIALMHSLLLPLFYKAYPEWVILWPGAEKLSEPLQTLYNLCCEHLSCEGGTIIVSGKPATFDLPQAEYNYNKPNLVANIRQACTALDLALDQSIGPLPILAELPIAPVKI